MNKDINIEANEGVTLDGVTAEASARGVVAAKLPQKSQYFGYPKNWDKSMAAVNSRRDQMTQYEQSNFHRLALKEVRKALGTSCKHLSHVTEQGVISFRAKVMIQGKLETINVNTEYSEAKELSAEDYKNLKDVLDETIRS